jgi:hypothetical protein
MTQSGVSARIDRLRFWPLPRPRRGDGAERATGVEIEFAGLDVAEAAALVAREWGGRPRPKGARNRVVEDTRFGDIEVERDTALGTNPAEQLVTDILGELIPVEIVTPPLTLVGLAQVDGLIEALRLAGARGTRDALAFGFGLHLNTEVAAEDAGFVLPVVRAYALLEDWLRAADPIDIARRVLPFVTPWPPELVDRLAAEGARWSIDDLIAHYLDLTPTRNRGLDLLPLLEHLRPGRVSAVLGPDRVKAPRPTFHYRLPEARVDEADWTLAYEWNRWCLVERVAARPGLLADLAEAWGEYRAALTRVRADWALEVEARLLEARIWDA